MLLFDRQVPVAPAPVVGGRNGPPEASNAGLARQLPSASPGSLPVTGESQEVEGTRALSGLLPRRRTPEVQQTCLVRVKSQAKPAQSWPENPLHALCIVLALEGHHEVVSVTDEPGLALHPRPNFGLEPQVERIVQVDVPE